MPSATTSTPAAGAATRPVIHVFRPGRHTTMAGEEILFSEADLAATAAAYDPALGRAPVVKGHPKTDDPAQAWITGLTVTERGLYATVDQVDAAFAEEVRSGRWGAVSLKWYRPTDPRNPKPGVWYPQHLGFLGAANPAVKGLEPPAFAQAADAGDAGVCFTEAVAFSGWTAATQAGLWGRMREWMLTRFGQEDADRVLPSYEVKDLERSAHDEIRAEADEQPSLSLPAFAEAGAAGDHSQESSVTEEEARLLREQNAKLQRDHDALLAAEAARQAQAIQTDAVAFAERMVGEARIPAADRDLVAAITVQLQGSTGTAAVEFGEGDARRPLHQAWRDHVQARAPMTALGEQATTARAAAAAAGAGADALPEVQYAEGEVDADRLALDRRIRAHAAQHQISYAAAAQAVMRG